jgi:fucose permease
MFTTVVSTAFVLTGVVTTFLGPILPVLALRWGLSDSRSGYFFTAQFLGSMLGVGISSFLLPRSGFRFSLGLAYLLMAGGVSGLVLPEWKTALLGTFAFGLGLGVAIPVSNLLISGLNQDRRSSALSILNFCWGLGAVAAPVALAMAEHRNHVPAFVYVLAGLLLLSTVSLVFVPKRELPVDETQAPAAESGTFNWPFAAIIGGMFFLYVAVESSVGGWIATLMARAPEGASHAWLPASSLFWGGLLTGRGLAPLVLRKFRERSVVLASLLVACTAICVLVLSSGRQWIAVGAVATGFGLAAVFPITISLLSCFQGMEKRIAGPMFALAGLGGAVMPWLVGAISTLSGSLQTGLLPPLLASALLLWLHVVGNHGPKTIRQAAGQADPPKQWREPQVSSRDPL